MRVKVENRERGKNRRFMDMKVDSFIYAHYLLFSSFDKF
jgi:hypothetical protein